MFQVPTQYICQGCAFDIGFRQCIEWGTISTRIGRSCLLRGTYLESHKNFIAKSGPNRPVQPKMAAFTSSLFFFHCTANPNALKCEASAVKTSLGFPVGPSLPHPSSDAVFFFFLFSSGGNQTPLSSSDAAFFLSQITLRLVRGQTATKPLMPCPSSTLSCRGVREVMLSSKGLLPYHMERAGRLCRRHLRSCGRQELSRNQTLIKASASSKMVGNLVVSSIFFFDTEQGGPRYSMPYTH